MTDVNDEIKNLSSNEELLKEKENSGHGPNPENDTQEVNIEENPKNEDQVTEVQIEGSAMESIPQDSQRAEVQDIQGNPEDPGENQFEEEEFNEEEENEEDHEDQDEEMAKLINEDNLAYSWMVQKLVKSEIIESSEDRKITDEIKEKMLTFLAVKDKGSLFIKYSEYTQQLIASYHLQDIYIRGDSNFNFCFFLKKDQKMPINVHLIDMLVVYDSIYGNINKYTLDKMNEKLVPYILELSKWPEGIKKDLINNMHKFMISLSQAYYSDQKQIVLYIPRENISNRELVVKDKDLINRLEGIMIEWTTQIRDFVTNQETVTNREDFHVINEIEFWDLRNTNLTNISAQLENKELLEIIDILKEVKKENSDNLKAFVSIKDSILEEKRRAEEILKFVKVLKEPCLQLTKSEIKDIPPILHKIMDKIRVISGYCNSYDSSEKVAELIKKVSNQLLHKFTEKINENIKNIVEVYSEELHNDIKLIKNCIADWKKIYNAFKECIKKNESVIEIRDRWNFESKDYQNIFYDLESFEKRCQNLEDICLCQLQFGKNKNEVQPVFGGTKRYEIVKQLNDIEEKFDDQMKNLFHEKSNVLDIKVNKWQEDYRIFSKHIEDLEDMYKNTISSAFKRVNTVEEAINYVENFYSLARLSKIKNFIKMDIALEIVALCTKEIEQLNMKNESKGFVRSMRQTVEGGNALWSKFLCLRLEDYNKCLARMNQIFNPKKPKDELPYQRNKKMDELKVQIKHLETSIKSYLLGENPALKEELEMLLKVNDLMLDDKLKIPLVSKYEPPQMDKPYFTKYQCNFPPELMHLFAINNCLSRFEEYTIPPDIVNKVIDLDERTRPLRELVIQVVREYNNLVDSIKTPTEQSIFQEEFNRLIAENISRVQNRFWNSNGNETYLNKFRIRIKEVNDKINQFSVNSQAIQDIYEQIAKKSFFMLEKNNDIYEKVQFEFEQKKVREATSIFISQKASEILDYFMKSFKYIESVEEPEVFRGFKNYIEENAEKYNEGIEKALVNSIVTMHKTMLGADKNSNPPVFLKINIQLAEQKAKKDKLKNYEFNPPSLELNGCITEMLAEMQKCALNAPDIIKMFYDANETFNKKMEKKKQDDKLSRPLINNINNIVAGGSTENQAKEEKRGNVKKDKRLASNSPPKNRNPQQAMELKLQPLQNLEKQELGRSSKFPKAEEAKRSFQNDLKSKNLDKEFKFRLEKWESCKRINEMAMPLQEDENVKYINDKFKGFLIEGKVTDLLITALRDNIDEKNKFKAELSSADSGEDQIPETIDTFLFLQFDATPVKHRLIDICENIVTFNLNYITDKTKNELIDKVNSDFTEHERKFKNEPETQDDYKQLHDDLIRYMSEKEFRFKKIRTASDLVHQIIAVNQTKGPAEDLINEVMLLEKRKDSYNVALEEAENMLYRARQKLSSAVDKEETAFRHNVDEMRRDFLSRVPDKITANIRDELNEVDLAERTLAEFTKTCKVLKAEEQSVKKGLKLFSEVLNKPFDENNKDLIDVEEQIKELNKIWTIRKKMCEVVRHWCNSQFYVFDLTQMEIDRSMIENEFKNNCKELRNKAVYLTMKDQLELYSQVITVLILLRDDAMDNQSHWDKIQSNIGIPSFNPHSLEFNFERILELKLEQSKDIIETQVNYAREQQKVDKGIELIKSEWKKNKLEFDFNEREQTFRLLANTKMNNDLESHLTKIAEYKSTPYYEDFKEKIDNLENDLNKLSDVYQLLKQVIEKWTYLKNVFSKNKDDMEQQSGFESSNLRASNDRFMEMLKVFSRIQIVKDCFLQKNIEPDLRKLFSEFASIERGLYSLLETKRNNFTRFYFLSNDDFLELLGNSEDSKIINFHLSKLFLGIERVDIDTIPYREGNNPIEKRKIIQNVYDILDEKLKLENYIFVTSVIETWLKDLEKQMIESLEKLFSNFYTRKSFEFSINKNDDIDTTLTQLGVNGQMLLTLSQYSWRKKVEFELIEAGKSEKQDGTLDKNLDAICYSLTESVNKIVKYLEDKKDNITKKNRMILYNYILITKHHLDITMFLRQERVRTVDNYDWQKLLKINMVQKKNNMAQRGRNKNVDDRFILQAEQLNNVVNYGYEYIGNKERLVITGLTERCFLTMMTAISVNRGSSLQGPAGTGKTETVKDLARNLAKYVIVFNCSNKNTYSTMETIFLGLLKTGAWCCFDEFNRIEIEVLSVVRIQLNIIYDGLRAQAKHVPFKKQHVEVNRDLAIFITTNPAYMFRSEMPDNLKTLFRPIAVTFADKQMICEIRFYAEGYSLSALISQKLVTCFDVMEQQLSKQPHYDFSLRTIISVLAHAGTLKKTLLTTDEQLLLKIAISDMIKPKLVSDDEDIFEMIMNSIFNEGKEGNRLVTDSISKDNYFREEIKQEIAFKGYCGSSYLVTQTVQLYNYMKIKHSVMLVGDSLSGKSTCLKILQSLSTNKAKKDMKNEFPEFANVHITTLYPKSIEIDDFYGKQVTSAQGTDSVYQEGLLPYHLKELCNMKKDESRFVKWLVLDGPVDSLWIESMNTLLDETKMLSLPSGYRINLKPDVKVVFETENLSQATPATVSRVGLIFFEANKLSWFPIARNWLDKRMGDKEMYDNLAKWFDKYVYGILGEIKELKMNFLINYHENHIITSFLKLFDAFIDEVKGMTIDGDENLVEPGENMREKYWELAERIFIFSFMWAIGGSLDEKGRITVDAIIRKYCSSFPPHSTIFDFVSNNDKDEWITWEDKMIPYSPAPNSSYNEIFVHTVDIIRVKSIIQNLIKANSNPFIIGMTGTGKSSIVNKMIFKTIDSKYQCIDINLSYGVLPLTLQQLIEYNFEKRNNKLFPPSNKKAICFIEDLNLPRKDQFGCQTIVEMLRQCVELDGWYGVDQLTYVNIKSMLLMASTTIRGSNKSSISQRFLSKFVPLTILNPNDTNKTKIFHTIVSHYLSNFGGEDIKKLTEGLTHAMIGLYNSILEKENYLPTPTKCHYIFNIRDISKIFESFSKTKNSYVSSRDYFIRQWVHESFRTLNDRFIYDNDKQVFRDIINRQLEVYLGTNLRECMMKENKDCMFVDFMGDYYEDVPEFEEVKKTILSKVEGDKAFAHMVFFDQAINYICVINRILNKHTGGHGLLLGLGASGRASYIKIASELSNYKVSSMNAARDLKIKDWLEFIKTNMRQAAIYNNKISIVIKETDLFHEEIIEDINLILTTGIIPNILLDDWEIIKQESPNLAIQNMPTENFIQLFKKNCSENLKIFLKLSPLSDKLRDYCRNYPSIIDHTTCVYFTDWPESALNEVARSFTQIKFSDNKTKSEQLTEEEKEYRETLIIDVADIFAQVHLSVKNVLLKMEAETKRKAYFTSSSFVTFIKTFNKYISLKYDHIINSIGKYKLGLQKIKTGKVKIDIMSIELEEKNKEEILKFKELEKLIDEINEKKKIAQEQETDLEYERQKNEKNQRFFAKNLEESKKELEEAQKPMQEARDIVDKRLDRNKLAEFKNTSEAKPEIKNVFFALMAIFNRPTNWGEVRSYLQELKLEDLQDIDNLPITERGNLPKIQSFSKDFNFNTLKRMNVMMPDLALYIHNVEKYFKAKWNAEVKRKNLNEADNQMRMAMDNLKLLENKLTDIKIQIDKLENDKKEKEAALDTIKDETARIKLKLDRASFLITAFKSEESRWTESLLKNEDLLKNVLGNTILASGILTYFGVFSAKFREDLLRNYWIPILQKKNIFYSEKFDFLEFISNIREIDDWKNNCGLKDTTFLENGVIIKYSLAFPLIIDPQDQALNWIKKMHNSHEGEEKQVKSDRKIRQFTPQMHNYLRIVRECVDKSTVIINNIGETLGMDLEEFLKTINKEKSSLFLMTKVPNPHFYPSVSSCVNIINFLVNERGLEEQMLTIVVEMEKKETEIQIRESRNEIFKMRKDLDRSEEKILQYLNNADDNFLEEDHLIRELKSLKEASTKATDHLKSLNQNMEKIMTSREEYRPLARKVSKFFFVLYSMNNINNMYEFSLDSYENLFRNSVLISSDKQNSSESSDERIKSIEKFHLQRIIQFTNQCLFENHRLLFSLQLCLALIIANEDEIKKDFEKKGMMKFLDKAPAQKEEDDPLADKKPNTNAFSKLGIEFFNMNEFKLLIQSSVENIDISGKGFHKPSWINYDSSWKFIIGLENKIPDFKGIFSSFTNNNQDWYKWYTSKEIEKEDLPVEWEGKCKGETSVRKLLFIKALRPDKFATALRGWINKNLGIDLKDEPFSLKEILMKEVNCFTPLMIIHGSGIDPSESLQKIWEEELANAMKEKDNKENTQKMADGDTMNLLPKKTNEVKASSKDEKEKKEKKFLLYTLNQDQLVFTINEIQENSKIGGWIYLANTHLTLQSVPLLEKTLDDLKDVHPDFRLIISTNPNPKYPISFLQRCKKITFETPKGVGTIMTRLFDDLQKENIVLGNDKLDKGDLRNSAFSKMVYSLCMFHSILMERRKFKSYGWTSFYDFNNSDFKICFDLIKVYMQKFNNATDFPWKALQELIAINYGSRFSNEKDLALLNTYSRQFFNPKLISDKNYNFSSSPEFSYLLPDENMYERFKNTNTSDSQFYSKSDFFIRMNFFKEEAKKMNKEDPPELFGLHFNAEISAHIQDNLELIENIRLVSPDLVVSGGSLLSVKDDSVLKKINFALEKIPPILNIEVAKGKILLLDKNAKSDPIIYVLYQESSRYNQLISLIKSDLTAIESALKGNTTLTPNLERQINSIYEDKVPFTWAKFYNSTKPFASFMIDLNQRVEFFNNWLSNGITSSYFLGYFANPFGFITAVKQKFSLENRISFNKVKLDFKVINEDEQTKLTKIGYLIKGIYIEGGQWDKKYSGIKDENIQDLYTTLPPVVMIPINDEMSGNQGPQIITAGMMGQGPLKHWFPLYYIPFRGDYLGKPSYVMDICLNILRDKDKEGSEKTDREYIAYWIKKGTCLLLSKND